MKYKKQISYGSLTGLLVVIYCCLVALFMFNMDHCFRNAGNTMITIAAMLMLLVISAAITGTLVFAYPAYLFVNKKFKEGICSLVSSLAAIVIGGLLLICAIYIIFKLI